MAVPTLTVVSGDPSVASGGTTRSVAASFSSGDTLLIFGVTEDRNITMGTPSGSGLGILSPVTPLATANSCWVGGWSGTATANGSSVTISSTLAGTNAANRAGFLAVAVVSAGTSDGFAVTSPTVAATPTASVARSGTDSTVLMFGGDWSAVTPRAASPAGTAVTATQVPGLYTGYVLRWDSQGVPGTTSYGVSGANFGELFSKLLVEVKGTTVQPYVAPRVSVNRAAVQRASSW